MILTNCVAHGHAIARAIGRYYHAEDDSCISRSYGHQLLCGVIYQGYTKSSITMHTATFYRNSYGRDMLWIMFHYPFEALSVKVLFAPVEEVNDRSIALCRKLGFKEVARIADYYPSGAQRLYAMRRDECRWLVLKPRSLLWDGETDGRRKRTSKTTRKVQADRAQARPDQQASDEVREDAVEVGKESLPRK